MPLNLLRMLATVLAAVVLTTVIVDADHNTMIVVATAATKT